MALEGTLALDSAIAWAGLTKRSKVNLSFNASPGVLHRVGDVSAFADLIRNFNCRLPTMLHQVVTAHKAIRSSVISLVHGRRQKRFTNIQPLVDRFRTATGGQAIVRMLELLGLENR
jgi:hypothetical protein